MPDVVKAEIRFRGNPDVTSWGPVLKNWLNTSTHPRVERWRRDLRELTRRRYRASLKRQKRTSELAQAVYGKQNGSIRASAVLDPVFRDYNEDKFRGKRIAEEKKDSPKIFIN